MWAPTRWHSERCVDCIVANDPQDRVRVQFEDTKILDHKMLLVGVDTAGLDVAQSYHKQSMSCCRKPGDVAVQEWQASVAKRASAIGALRAPTRSAAAY